MILIERQRKIIKSLIARRAKEALKHPNRNLMPTKRTRKNFKKL